MSLVFPFPEAVFCLTIIAQAVAPRASWALGAVGELARELGSDRGASRQIFRPIKGRITWPVWFVSGTSSGS